MIKVRLVKIECLPLKLRTYFIGKTSQLFPPFPDTIVIINLELLSVCLENKNKTGQLFQSFPDMGKIQVRPFKIQCLS